MALTKELPRVVRGYMLARPGLLACVVPAAAAFVAAQSWFKSGHVIATGDLTPPIPPAGDYRALWNDVAKGEGSPSYEIAWFPYYELLRLASDLGISDSMFQRLWLSVLFAACAVAGVFFVSSFAPPLVAGAAGCFVVFNAYRMTTAADPIPLVATIVAFVLGGIVMRAALHGWKTSTAACLCAVASLPLGFVLFNPPHLVLVAGWVAISAAIAVVLGGRHALVRLGKLVAPAALLVVAVGLWWIVPAAVTLLGPESSSRVPAYSVEAWSWTHRRASLLNAFSLNTAWGWHEPIYFPFSAGLERPPFDLLRFFLPALALAGLVLAAGLQRRVAFVLAAAGGVLVVLAKGLHEPWRGLNEWLYGSVPGLWLFRDPAKFILLLSFVYAILAGIALGRLTQRRPRLPLFSAAMAAVLAAGAVAYVYPLFRGDVIPDERPVEPPAHVRVPGWWHAAAAAINRDKTPGKVLVLPALEYYQAPTKWGYWGASFSRFIIARGVLEVKSETGAYLSSRPIVPRLVDSVQADLASRMTSATERKLRALGVSFILVRRDLREVRPWAHFASASAIRRSLIESPLVERVGAFGQLDVFRLRDPVGHAYVARVGSYRGSGELLPAAIGGGPIVAIVGGSSGLTTAAGVIRATRGRWVVSARRVGGGIDMRLAENVPPTAIRHGVPRLPTWKVHLHHHGAASFVTVGDRPFSLPKLKAAWATLGTVPVTAPVTLRVWEARRQRQRLRLSADNVGDCNRYDSRSVRALGMNASTANRGGVASLRLSARDHRACVRLNLGSSPGALYELRGSYRTVRGMPAFLCIWQVGDNRCAGGTALRPGRSWQSFVKQVTSTPRTAATDLFLYADGTNAEGDAIDTVTEYRGLTIRVYEAVADRTLAVPRVVFMPHSSSMRSVQRVTARHYLRVGERPARSVGDCNRLDPRPPSEVGISYTVREGSGGLIHRLAAHDHAACVNFAIQPFDAAAQYELRVRYRRVSGSTPRICVWQEPTNRCAELPPLLPSDDWQQLSATVVPDEGATALRLYLYADGDGREASVAEYTDMSARASIPVAIMEVAKPAELPTVATERTGATEYRVSVRNARAPFVLVLPEAYASAWRASVVGRTAELEHVVANGYANGWVVRETGDYDVVISYGLQRYAVAAQWISIATLVPLLCLLAVQTSRRWRRVEATLV